MSAGSEWLLLNTVLTVFVCWALLETMEHAMGMAPKIVTVDQLNDRARNDRTNPSANLAVNTRLTKSFYGSYRMQTRGSIHYIRFLWSGCLFVAACAIYFHNNLEWFIDHFILLKVLLLFSKPYYFF